MSKQIKEPDPLKSCPEHMSEPGRQESGLLAGARFEAEDIRATNVANVQNIAEQHIYLSHPDYTPSFATDIHANLKDLLITAASMPHPNQPAIWNVPYLVLATWHIRSKNDGFGLPSFVFRVTFLERMCQVASTGLTDK